MTYVSDNQQDDRKKIIAAIKSQLWKSILGMAIGSIIALLIFTIVNVST